MDKVKIIIFCSLAIGLSCQSKKESNIVFDIKKLTQENIGCYNKLRNEISIDFKYLYDEAKKNDYSINPNYLLTSTVHLYKLNKEKYEPIITKLKNADIYENSVHLGLNETYIFTLQNETLNDTLHSHILIYNPPQDFFPPFSGQIEVINDSLINQNWKYLYFKVRIGH